MKIRFSLLVCSAIALLMTAAYLEAQSQSADIAKTASQRSSIEDKRVEKEEI
jgi:hypothetical protein